jgi:ketosteroid isomerase-like protein
MTVETDIKRAIEMLEHRRIEATLSRDLDALASLLDDDLRFVHSTGRVDRKLEYLNFIGTVIRTLRISRRSAPEYRLHGDTMVTSGLLEQTIQRARDAASIEIAALTTQVWVRFHGQWRLLHQHSSRIAT